MHQLIVQGDAQTILWYERGFCRFMVEMDYGVIGDELVWLFATCDIMYWDVSSCQIIS